MIHPTKKEKWLLVLTSILYTLNAAMILFTTWSIAKVMECAELGQVEKLPITILTAVGVVILEKPFRTGKVLRGHW